MTRDRIGIDWSWDDALRGTMCALPAVPIILVVDVSLGICLGLGTLLAAIVGVPAEMKARSLGMVVAAVFALAYALGCVIGQWPVVAVAALATLAFASVPAAQHRPAARLLAVAVVPAFAIGMNEPPPEGFVVAAMFLAGGLWATFVSLMWHPMPGPPEQRARFASLGAGDAGERATGIYAACFAAAVGVSLAIGFMADFQHPAWAAGAAAFIMRPDPGLLASRALGRILATFAGVSAAALLFHQGLGEWALAAVTVFTVSAMIATRRSPWYVTPAGSGLLVLLLSGVSSTQQFELSFHDRLLETAVGSGLAFLFGVIVPRVVADSPGATNA